MGTTRYMSKVLMVDTESWPQWPYLPVKRYDSSMENNNLGILVDLLDGKHWTVYHVNLYDIPQDLRTARRTEYATVDALLADGWVVD